MRLCIVNFFHDGGRYHIETSPLICSANQWTDFYMITASVMKELNSVVQKLNLHICYESIIHINDLLSRIL